jgi:hypothetical protein
VVGNWCALTQNKTGILKGQILNLSCKQFEHGCEKVGESGRHSEDEDTQGAEGEQKDGVPEHQTDCRSF